MTTAMHVLLLKGQNNDKRRNKKLTFKNNAPFRSCISKTNNLFIDNAEDLDIVIPMYTLLEHDDNYSMALGSLWNYYRDEINDENENDANKNMVNNKKRTTSKSFLSIR